MKKRKCPTLFDWAIIRISFPSNPQGALFLFTGIGYDHPRLQDFVQFVTTEIQEIGEDGTWGRTRSRIYSLTNQLDRAHFTSDMAAEVTDILRSETGLSCQIEWISIDDWRRAKRHEKGESPRE